MTKKGFSNEIGRARARLDIDDLRLKLGSYYQNYVDDEAGRKPEWTDDCNEVLTSGLDDPDKALALVVEGAQRFSPSQCAVPGCGVQGGREGGNFPYPSSLNPSHV